MNANIPHLASFGFCLPNKGFPELVKAIELMKKRDFECNLTLLTSKYSPDYDYFCNELVELVDNLGLNNLIKINFNYLSDECLLNFLSRVDLVVFPYQMTAESSSAAVRNGIASQSEVAVTPLHIFDDVSDVVHTLPGITPSKISDGLVDILSLRLHERKQNTRELQKYHNWRKQHLFSNLSRRLCGMIKALESDR